MNVNVYTCVYIYLNVYVYIYTYIYIYIPSNKHVRNITLILCETLLGYIYSPEAKLSAVHICMHNVRSIAKRI